MEVSEVSVSGYVRVSTQRQAQAQTIEQQLERIQTYAQQQGWRLNDSNIFRDDGYSGASLNRPGLDRLRDAVRCGEITHILMTAPDRLAWRALPAGLQREVLREAVRRLKGDLTNLGYAAIEEARDVLNSDAGAGEIALMQDVRIAVAWRGFVVKRLQVRGASPAARHTRR